MSCTKPNKIFYFGIDENTGKNKVCFAKSSTETVVLSPDGKYGQYSVTPDKIHINLGDRVSTDWDYIPCGQCLGCRIDYSRDWATRIMLESKKYGKDEQWFITFTFDDQHLPKPRFVDVNGTMKLSEFSSVSKRELQLLMKTIRNHYGAGLRFFACGEYGDISFRPHYHMILFGLKKPKDLMLYKRNWRGDELYTSEEFTHRVWSDDKSVPKGFVVFGRLSYDTAAYTARYVMKKRKGRDSKFYDDLGIDPEFCSMSRRPGIGMDYFLDKYEYIYTTDNVVVPSHTGASVVRVPKYFDYLADRFSDDITVDINEIKENRKSKAQGANLLRSDRRPFMLDSDIFSAKSRQYENKIIIKKKGV